MNNVSFPSIQSWPYMKTELVITPIKYWEPSITKAIHFQQRNVFDSLGLICLPLTAWVWTCVSQAEWGVMILWAHDISHIKAMHRSITSFSISTAREVSTYDVTVTSSGSECDLQMYAYTYPANSQEGLQHTTTSF